MTGFARKKTAVKTAEKKLVYKGVSFGKSENGKALVGDGCFAVDCLDGSLKAAFLWEQFPVHGSLTKLYDTAKGVRRALEVFDYSSGEVKRKFLYVAGSGEAYSYSEKAGGFVGEGVYFSDTPTVLSVFSLDGVENLLYCSVDGVVFYDTAKRDFSTLDIPSSTIACALWDRAFVACGARVYYCAPLDYGNWENSENGGGFVDFSSERGEIVGLAPVGEKLGVFFKNGISLLSVKSGAKKFERTDLAYPYGEILYGSPTASGRFAVFMTERGSFALDGEKVFPVLPEAAFGEIDGSKGCEGVAFKSSAYLTYYLTDGNKRMFVYDAEREAGYFVERPNAQALTASKDELFCSLDGKIYRLSKDGTVEFSSERGFVVKKTDFSYAGEKTLKSLKFKGKGQARVAVSSDRCGHVYTVDLQKDGCMVCPLLKGKEFDLKFIPLAGGEITSVEAVIVTVGGERKW